MERKEKEGENSDELEGVLREGGLVDPEIGKTDGEKERESLGSEHVISIDYLGVGIQWLVVCMRELVEGEKEGEGGDEGGEKRKWELTWD